MEDTLFSGGGGEIQSRKLKVVAGSFWDVSRHEESVAAFCTGGSEPRRNSSFTRTGSLGFTRIDFVAIPSPGF